jgi:transcription elongation factor GreB
MTEGWFMSKAFTRENEAEDEDDPIAPLPVATGKNYMTPAGYERLKAELMDLMDSERPKIVEVVHWAAGNGDRSENGDYHYGKKRLREIDRRIRFLTQRLEVAAVTDPTIHFGSDQVFFGATVRYADDESLPHRITILGVDEADSASDEISWISPVAKALLKSRVGDQVTLITPQGKKILEVLAVDYPAPNGERR